jgi:hypothetical protein
MKKLLSRLAFTVALVAGVVLLPGQAHATDTYGYVCEATLYPGTTTVYGNEGYANLTMYSAPACTGTYQGSFWVFTTGATSSWANPSFLYGQGSLLSLYESLVRAAVANKQIHLWTNPTYPNAVGTVSFTGKS